MQTFLPKKLDCSFIVSMVKMESVSKVTNFGLTRISQRMSGEDPLIFCEYFPYWISPLALRKWYIKILNG